MTRKLLAAVLLTTALIGVAEHAEACTRKSYNCESSGSSRLAVGRDGDGNIWAIESVPESSKLAQAYPPPKCSYTLDVPFTDDGVGPGDPDGDGLESKTFTDGNYIYAEVTVLENAGPEMLAEIESVASDVGGAWESEQVDELRLWLTATSTPLEATSRRFQVGCRPPVGGDIQFGTPYGGFVDVGPWDPLWGLQERIEQMRADLQLVEPVFAAPQEVGRWGGLVVRHPTWLAIDGEAWQTQTSPAESHYGWTLQIVAVPVATDFSLTFTATDRADAELDFAGVVGCIGTPTQRTLRITASHVPARPNDPDLEFSEPGIVEPCAWTAPARGQVTVQPTVTYELALLASTGAVRLDPYYRTGPARTLTVGELRAVNVNSDD